MVLRLLGPRVDNYYCYCNDDKITHPVRDPPTTTAPYLGKMMENGDLLLRSLENHVQLVRSCVDPGSLQWFLLVFRVQRRSTLGPFTSEPGLHG